MFRNRAQATLATDAQWSYLRRLLRERFAHHCSAGPNLDEHHMPTYYTKDQASADIKRLLDIKAKGWK